MQLKDASNGAVPQLTQILETESPPFLSVLVVSGD